MDTGNHPYFCSLDKAWILEIWREGPSTQSFIPVHFGGKIPTLGSAVMSNEKRCSKMSWDEAIILLRHCAGKVSQWRMRNLESGEIIPAEIFL